MDESSDIDAASWWLYELELVGDPSRHGELQILRPAAWQERVRHDATGSWLPLEIAEWNFHGEARLLSVKPCPPIQPGPGRVVLMKSTTRYMGELATLNLVGPADAIEGTYGHPIFSLDRGSYVPLGDLRPGEHVRTADGWALVESLARSWGVRTVHNLEVDAEHRYFVGEARVESHNAGCNGNSKSARRDQHLYDIEDTSVINPNTGKFDVVKNGLSGQKFNKNGTSPRANSQVNQLNKTAGTNRYQATITQTGISGRSKGLQAEKAESARHRANGNSMSEHHRP